MKAISGRLRRLETRMGLVETPEARRAREALEKFHARLARQARAEGREYDPLEHQRKDLAGLSIIEVLQRGRQRAQAEARSENT